MPGTYRASVCATWSNVLWSSLRTITRHSPPTPLPGSRVRGSSIVCPTVSNLPLSLRPVAIEAGPQRIRGHCLQEGLRRRRIGRAAHLGDHRLGVGLGVGLAGQRPPAVERLVHGRDLVLDVLVACEVGDRKALRLPRRDGVERLVPQLEVDVGRRSGRDDRAARDAHAADVADERGGGRLVQIADVVGGVAGRVLDPPGADRLAAAQYAQVGLGHGDDLAPQALHVVAVQARGARDQARGVDEVRGAALVDPHLDVGPLAHERAGRAGVVEMDVGEQNAFGRLVERLQQRAVSGLRARVDDRSVDLVAADDERVAEVVDVDLAGSGQGAGPYNRPMEHRLPEPDRPWMMRTYAGHSTAKKSNELYRSNLAKGQTGLSIAFDLPTQTGYDPDHELARGEVGKVGTPVAHKGDMHDLLDGIPLDQMNTSMTINATAAWLLALYIVTAEENGIDEAKLQGTTQNDIIKEFLARGTYAFPPGPSMRLIADMVAYTVEAVPRWNPINICSYHLQEAGATPVQEIAYAMSNAIAVLDAVRERVPQELMGTVFGRISFFVNAGVRFVEEHAKLRAMSALWEEIGRERYGVQDPKHLLFRYGVQVNSLGLTESQPENNVQRIVLEALAVTMGRKARARAIQLPAWNEALGLPRPWDPQWSLRIQQVLAYETDLLEYPDIFEGSHVMEGLVDELAEGARAEMRVVEEHGGAVEAVSYMKTQLVESHRERVRRIESGEQKVVGQNVYTEHEPSPLQKGEDGGILRVDPRIEQAAIESVQQWRSSRDQAAVSSALDALKQAAASETENIMPATLEAARAGATTGEWAAALREVFGEYRAPTGVAGTGPSPPRAEGPGEAPAR